MSTHPLIRLYEYGQSVWYDNIQRTMLHSGELQRLIADGVRGMTSNPTIFKNAIASGQEYQADINALRRQGRSPLEVYEALALADVGAAADEFRKLYEQSDGEDGYVSIEVSPRLAHDTQGTIAEASRLFASLGRPNIMIKVPATPAGIPAIRSLIGQGINVNVTLLFSLEVYRQVAEAYLDGLELLVANGGQLHQVASVASFFVSRVDTLTDRLLKTRIAAAHQSDEKARLSALQGKLAIANAKLAYRIFQEMFSSPRFQRLQAQGARMQRLLWASTSTKNPAYRDVIYVEELIGPHTVNTMPPATIEAFKDHGQLRQSLTEKVDEAEAVLAAIQQAGLDVGAITAQLLDEGVAAFAQSFEDLLATVAESRPEPILTASA